MKTYSLKDIDAGDLYEMIQHDFGTRPLFVRTVIGLLPDYLELVRRGQKTTTIRYRSGKIDYPVNKVLPLLQTPDYASTSGSDEVGTVTIEKLTIKRYEALNVEDAHRDGFGTLRELRNALNTIYGVIGSDEYVSIYTISIDG